MNMKDELGRIEVQLTQLHRLAERKRDDGFQMLMESAKLFHEAGEMEKDFRKIKDGLNGQ